MSTYTDGSQIEVWQKYTKLQTQSTVKKYVGITIQDYLSVRLWQHANHPRAAESYLNSAIQKHGKDAFEISLLEECDTPEEAKNREQYYKKWKLNLFRHPNGNGMNLTDGGVGSYGYKPTNETRAKYTGENNHNYGLTGVDNPKSR